MALTQQIITRLKPDAKPYEVRCEKLKGLLVRVQPSGTISFVCQYARGKRITHHAHHLNLAGESLRKLKPKLTEELDPE